MRYVGIPATDLRPSAICLGTGDMGSAIPEDDAFRMLDLFRDHGGTFLDTALVYGNWVPGRRGTSEKLLGRWLTARGGRDNVMLGTKGAHPELSTMHLARLAPADIIQDVDESLRNLQTDTIDLYWLHRDDPARPVAEIVTTLHDLVVAGKLRYFGCSNWRAPRIAAALAYAAACGWPGMVANQMHWNLAVVDMAVSGDPTVVGMDDELRQLHVATGLAAVAYSSQANGFFQRKHTGTYDGMRPLHQRMYAAPENERRAARVAHLAATTGLSVTELVLGYLQAQPFTTIPIVGCRNLEQLTDSLRAGDTQLSGEQVRYLEHGDVATGSTV